MSPFWNKKKESTMADQEKAFEDEELQENKSALEDSSTEEEPIETEENASENEAQVIEPSDDWQDKYMRLVAEFDNYRRRTRKEQEDIRQRERGNMIKDLLEVLDNFERAMQTEGIEDTSVYGGLQGTYQQLLSVIKAYGVKEIEAKGMPFNPNIHEAVGTIENPDEEDDIIAEEVQKGYLLGESQILRPSRVLVVKNN
jgi:molecular chaperone GrpE